MNRYTMRMLLRSIRGSLGRYLAILAIVALGVGFFAGLKSSYPAMRGTAERYLDEQRLYDFQLLSTLGFTGEDVEAFAALEGVAAAEGGYFTDAFLRFAGEENVYRLMSLPERVSLPVLTAGRLPEDSGECLADSHAFREEDIGKTVTLTPGNDEDTLELLPDGTYTIVGLARSPRYLSSVRGDSSLGSGKIHGFLYLTDEAFDSEAFHELCLWCDIDAPLYSETYTDARDRLEPSVKTLLNRRGQLRCGQLRAEAQVELDDAQAEIDKGWLDYEDGRREAEEKLRDAEQELRDAEQELADAKAQAEEDLQLEVYTLNRDTNQGHLTFGNDIRIIDGLANAFPVFFALVAALVCVTTMTRMVGEERTLIGTMKALGYSGGAVMSKYLLYSGSAALLGCAAGFFLGTTAIPYVVWTAYNMLYDYAKLDFYFGPRMYGLCLAASVLGTLLVTWLACRQELREKPAELIRPKAPKAGRRILLEYLGPLWRRLPFLSKVSLRNAFRHPLRVLMLLLGIGGCTALMVAGFGVKDSVGRISDYQYGEIFLYDLSVSLDTDDFADDAQAASLWAGDAERWAMTRQEPVTILTDREEKSSRLIAAADGALEGMISLHDRQGELPFPGPGQAVVTEKIAESLDLRVGDSLTLETDGGERLTVQISGICQNYLNHYVFLNSASLKEIRHNTALLRAAEGVDVDRLGARLRAAEGVDYVSLSKQERETMERSMASLDLLVLVLILCSGALAFITQYNLTNINIMERMREIATVKVLGFYPGETASYVLRENRLLAVLGAALGLVLGKLLHRVVIQAVVVDYMSFEIRIAPLSYVLAFAITIVFALLTNLSMHPKLEKVNMAESLKSVE